MGRRLSTRDTAKFILFDIDHTLIDSGGVGVIALNKALEDVTGISEGFKGISFAGKTDLQILREAMERLQLPCADGLPARFLGRYLTQLRAAMTTRNGHVKPGVCGLLQRLEEDDDFFLGLLTGNIEQGARIKLEPHSLNRFFPVGAFGDDGEDRNGLLPVAVQRLSLEQGVIVDHSNCVVIGDTPRDVECAKANGAHSIAVATGPFAVEDLRQTGAELVLPDLSGTDDIVNWLRNR
ncbi:MAG: HAD hydrolase-like protein [Desulfomonile tiedjei]|nr:HAD hydrolase-like protein [Desulfomonile tiedjei]